MAVARFRHAFAHLDGGIVQPACQVQGDDLLDAFAEVIGADVLRDGQCMQVGDEEETEWVIQCEPGWGGNP
ncbi:MAG: hypothetical protein ACRDQW_13375 [Haloechinothrix sp.]